MPERVNRHWAEQLLGKGEKDENQTSCKSGA